VARNGRSRSGLLPKPKAPSLNLGGSRAAPSKALSAARKGLKNANLPRSGDAMIEWVEEKARGVGDAGYQVAELTSNARRVKNTASGG
jgi:hypothetical protein